MSDFSDFTVRTIGVLVEPCSIWRYRVQFAMWLLRAIAVASSSSLSLLYQENLALTTPIIHPISGRAGAILHAQHLGHGRDPVKKMTEKPVLQVARPLIVVADFMKRAGIKAYWSGNVSDEDPTYSGQSTNFHVVPPLQEGSGCTVVEAWLTGVPVIASDNRSTDT
jgi:hypothetical protein